MGVVRVKAGVTFPATGGTYTGYIAPGGFRILSALDRVAAQFPIDLWITSGSDGCHSGQDDPHHRAEAFDVRSHDLAPDLKQQVLALIQKLLGDRFYAFLEDEGTDNEHIHVQVKKGTVYP